MAKRIVRKSGPPNTVRPFAPTPFIDEPAEKVLDTLESIAVSLAAIDHNLEVLVDHIKRKG